jgi:alpha-mannosidase
VITSVGEEVQFDWGVSDSTAGRLRYRLSWNVPAQRRGDTREMDAVEEVFLQVTLSLAPGSRRLDVKVDVTNYARDHRLRVLFPTGLSAATHCHAEQAFDVVARSIALPDCTGWREPQPPTAPQKTFVDVSDGKEGLCLINRGIPEYEVKDDAERTLALTLLRCTGSGVGTPEEQEEGQMQGTHTFEFALYPHAGDWEDTQVWREAHNFNVPMRAVQTDLHNGSLPSSHSFLRLAPDSIVPTAVKRSEDGQALVIRAVNYASRSVEAQIGTTLDASTAQSARLDETPTGDLPVRDGAVTMDVPARRIVTVRFGE